jgi:hypothetical protein
MATTTILNIDTLVPGLKRPLDDGPTISDLMFSLIVGNARRGIKKPHVEFTASDDYDDIRFRAVIIGLLRLKENSDIWEVCGRTIQNGHGNKALYFVASYSTDTRSGWIKFFESKKDLPRIAVW